MGEQRAAKRGAQRATCLFSQFCKRMRQTPVGEQTPRILTTSTMAHACVLGEPGVRLALTTALYKSESISLGRGAKIAAIPLVDFMQHVSREGIPVIRGSIKTVREDVRSLESWLKSPNHGQQPRGACGASGSNWRLQVARDERHTRRAADGSCAGTEYGVFQPRHLFETAICRFRPSPPTRNP